MAGFKLNKLSGLIPRLPDSLLPESAATVAKNCDFAYGELRATKGGFGLFTMANTPASIYTDNGLSFFSWTSDVDAVRSPLVSDPQNRLYYTGDSGFKVTNRLSQKLDGGPPATSYLVGTHRPTSAPVLTVQEAEPVTTATASIAFKFHWEYGGVKYQEQTIAPTTINNTQYQFTAPAIAADTNASAFPVLRMTAKWLRDGAQVFDLYTENSSFDSTGGLYSLSMSKNADGTFTATMTTGIKEEDKEVRSYVFTQVNVYGEEGPPSDPALVTTSPVIPVSVQLTKNQVTGYAPIKELRIYRTGTGTTLTDYFYLGTINVLASTTVVFNDNIKAELLNEVMSSLNYYPPNQNLKGLMALPNGILCAWKDNELHFSEAYKPWAWPPSYVKTVPNAIVGGIVYGSGAAITTSGFPYLVSGVSPDSMTVSKINVNQAGVSKWSIAVVDGSVVYASNDGIVTISGASASLTQSQQFFTREVWRKSYSGGLASMRFCVWDGRLVVFSSSSAFVSFMIRFDEAGGSMTELPELIASFAFVSQLSDQMYYGLGQKLYQFNGGDDQQCTWQSREMTMQKPVNFGMAQVLCEGTWRIEFFAWVQKTATNWAFQSVHVQSANSGTNNFRLPGGYESDRYKILISGSGRFRELRVAQSARELANI